VSAASLAGIGKKIYGLCKNAARGKKELFLMKKHGLLGWRARVSTKNMAYLLWDGLFAVIKQGHPAASLYGPRSPTICHL